MARDVEGLEVVVIVFDLGPLLDGIAGPGEEMLDPLEGAGNRVQSTQVLTTARQSHINGFTGKFLLDGGTFKIASPGIDGFFDLPLGFIDFLAGGRALLSRKLAQSFRLLGNHTLLAKILNTNLIKCLQAVGAINCCQPVLNQLLQVFH